MKVIKIDRHVKVTHQPAFSRLPWKTGEKKWRSSRQNFCCIHSCIFLIFPTHHNKHGFYSEMHCKEAALFRLCGYECIKILITGMSSI